VYIVLTLCKQLCNLIEEIRCVYSYPEQRERKVRMCEIELETVVRACEAEAEGSQVPGQPGLHSRTCLKKPK
jgi:hypothetical protein